MRTRLSFLIALVYLGLVKGCDQLDEVPCPKPTDVCRCVLVETNTVLCCNIISGFVFKESFTCANMTGGRNTTTSVHIRNSTIDELNASDKLWSNLDSLSITESRINRISGQFKGQLSCVNLSSNSLDEIDEDVFLELPNLHTLDLSKNQLTKLPFISATADNVTLDISGNKRVWCHSVLDVMEASQNSSTQLNFRNDNNTFCLSSRSFHWFNTTETVPLVQVEMLKRLEQECPRTSTYKCHCSSYRLDILPGKPPTFAVQVDCSGQQLTELPPELPPNTILLNVTNNNISSLDPLSNRESYHVIRELFADNNNIESITVLEGSPFIHNFAILSLRGNKLKSIPTYILSNTFDRNWHPRHVKLGGNKLNCDCSTAQVLKMWLMANKGHIPDYDEVLCDKDLEKVIYLDQAKVCVYQKDWTDYIYYIIACELILLILLVSKVSYDYWVFKTAGYLPWPASKMPKLPCDWVFEN